nr:hypothetical protein [uncultured Flavobacterium sp.]
MKKIIFLLCLSLFTVQLFAQNRYELRKELNQIISTKKATAGISIKGISKFKEYLSSFD